jgi:peroxiredoxin
MLAKCQSEKEGITMDASELTAVKQNIRKLKKEKAEILGAAPDRKRLKRMQRQIKLLKRQTRILAKQKKAAAAAEAKAAEEKAAAAKAAATAPADSA